MSTLEEKARQYEATLGTVVRRGGRPDASPPLRWVQLHRGLIVERGREAFAVWGAIQALYESFGGPLSGLGAPTSDERPFGDGLGRVSDFEHGQILWSPTTGAHEVHGEIRRFLFSPAGNLAAYPGAANVRMTELGYPITDELATPRECYQFFERGSIVYDKRTGQTRLGCPPDRLFGWADTHAHPANHLAFGGSLLHGEPIGEPQQALRSCEETHGVGGGHLVSIIGGALAAGAGMVPAAWLAAGSAARAGVQWVLEGSPTHATHGYGSDGHFDGWPRWDSLLHQSMHISWLRRCHAMGQRLMVALVANNEVLAAVASGPALGRTGVGAGADVTQVRQQIDFIISQLATEGADFLTIVRTPGQAREEIAKGRLAVVLGVELDDLMKLAPRPGGSEEQRIRDVVGMLDGMGIRYAFPVHLVDNGFGDMALYEKFFEINSAVAGRGIPQRTSSPDVDYDREGNGPGYVNGGGGLSAMGLRLLDEMKARKWMIDIDHMSWHTTKEALEWATANNYPVVSGHATLHDVVAHGDPAHGRNESRKTRETLDAISRLGGFVGVQTIGLATRPGAGRTLGCPDAAGTTHSFALSYLKARESLGDRVVLGSDANGLAKLIGPRFGPAAAPHAGVPAQRAAQERQQVRGVRYLGPVSYLDSDRFRNEGAMSPEETEALRLALAAEGPRGGNRGVTGRAANIVKGIRIGRDNLPRPSVVEEAIGWVAARGGDGRDQLPAHERRFATVLQEVLRRRALTPGITSAIPRCQAGRRDWDYNYDGLAHYGLLPDLIVDTANLGLAQDGELRSLLRGSEVVVSTWERCERPELPVPGRTLVLDPPTCPRATLDFIEAQVRVQIPTETPRMPFSGGG